MEMIEHNGRILAAATGRPPAIAGVGPSHYPEDLLNIALADPAIRFMRADRWDLKAERPAPEPVSLVRRQRMEKDREYHHRYYQQHRARILEQCKQARARKKQEGKP
jgi:hypothetical protein